VTKARAQIKYSEGSLVQNGTTLAVENDSVFSLPNGPTYTFRQDGARMSFMWQSPGMRDRVYQQVTKVVPSKAELGEYVGTYHSHELDVDYLIAVKDSELTVKGPRVEAMELEPYIKDAFTGPFLVEFVRDKRKRVTGFLLSTGRSRNLVFTK